LTPPVAVVLLVKGTPSSSPDLGRGLGANPLEIDPRVRVELDVSCSRVDIVATHMRLITFLPKSDIEPVNNDDRFKVVI
jgi:hypothetical protein